MTMKETSILRQKDGGSPPEVDQMESQDPEAVPVQTEICDQGYVLSPGVREGREQQIDIQLNATEAEINR